MKYIKGLWPAILLVYSIIVECTIDAYHAEPDLGILPIKMLIERSAHWSWLRSVERVHGLFLFPLVLGKMYWVATCEIGSFLCSLDNLLQKNVIVLFWEIKFQNGAHLKKGLLLTYFSHFLVTREKLQTFLQHISHSHTYPYFAHPIDFFALPILKKIRINQTRFLFGMSPSVDSYLRLYGTINNITKWWAKFKLACLLLICTYTNAKFIVICKPRTLNDGGGGEDSVKYRI